MHFLTSLRARLYRFLGVVTPTGVERGRFEAGSFTTKTWPKVYVEPQEQACMPVCVLCDLSQVSWVTETENDRQEGVQGC